jgi:hypothetical protein
MFIASLLLFSTFGYKELCFVVASSVQASAHILQASAQALQLSW